MVIMWVIRLDVATIIMPVEYDALLLLLVYHDEREESFVIRSWCDNRSHEHDRLYDIKEIMSHETSVIIIPPRIIIIRTPHTYNYGLIELIVKKHIKWLLQLVGDDCPVASYTQVRSYCFCLLYHGRCVPAWHSYNWEGRRLCLLYRPGGAMSAGLLADCSHQQQHNQPPGQAFWSTGEIGFYLRWLISVFFFSRCICMFVYFCIHQVSWCDYVLYIKPQLLQVYIILCCLVLWAYSSYVRSDYLIWFDFSVFVVLSDFTLQLLRLYCFVTLFIREADIEFPSTTSSAFGVHHIICMWSPVPHPPTHAPPVQQTVYWCLYTPPDPYTPSLRYSISIELQLPYLAPSPNHTICRKPQAPSLPHHFVHGFTYHLQHHPRLHSATWYVRNWSKHAVPPFWPHRGS